MHTLWRELAKKYQDMNIECPDLKSISLAQWILEAGRDPSPLATDHYNFGGLKWRSEMAWYAEKVKYTAHDGTHYYCKFDSPESFIKGYWRFIDRSPYRGWRKYSDDPEDYIKFIGKIYCPHNNQYADNIINLQDEAKKLLGKFQEGVHTFSVALEVGHGPHPEGHETGASGIDTNEYRENLYRAKLIADILEDKGIDTEVIDDCKTLIDLGKMAEGFDVFVSLHLNACDSHMAQGAETFIHRNHGSDDKKLAEYIQKRVCDALKINNRGVKECGFSVLVESTPRSAACLSEAFFIDYIKTPGQIREMSKKSAYAIAEGIMDYLNSLGSSVSGGTGGTAEGTETANLPYCIFERLEGRFEGRFIIVDKDGNRTSSTARSGQPGYQSTYWDRSLSPIPPETLTVEGKYTIDLKWAPPEASDIGSMGDRFYYIKPIEIHQRNGDGKRSYIGLHSDNNYRTAIGTAGCIGIDPRPSGDSAGWSGIKEKLDELEKQGITTLPLKIQYGKKTRKKHWAQGDYDRLLKDGLVTQKSRDLSTPITWGEFAVMINRLRKKE